MKMIEKEADTVEEAIEEALLELSVRRDEVQVEVLQKPTRGILG